MYLAFCISFTSWQIQQQKTGNLLDSRLKLIPQYFEIEVTGSWNHIPIFATSSVEGTQNMLKKWLYICEYLNICICVCLCISDIYISLHVCVYLCTSVYIWLLWACFGCVMSRAHKQHRPLFTASNNTTEQNTIVTTQQIQQQINTIVQQHNRTKYNV